jgi:hypothetical protein
MQVRNIITSENVVWRKGYREQRVSDDHLWERAFKSDWIQLLDTSICRATLKEMILLKIQFQEKYCLLS